ncbi:uncharacterized protein LOC111624306 [Centruroides sculpturatus]|uniref:uncharacterized protein LOC111624306 n=1 Tax=Centruroides sculpturatus TaxID=218467 RepID=UPI000C6DF402|nr:uncharacterized protein LOC111624306 [Centruroides sculpturatus]
MLRTLMAFICIFPECHPKWVSYYKKVFHSNFTNDNDKLLNVRSKRSVEWSPEYQMYEEWAKEYYQSHATPIVVVPDKPDSKDILEKFFELQRNATTMDRFRQSNFFNYTLTGMAVIAGVFFVCFLLHKIVKLVTRKKFRQDQNSRIFLEEAERFLNVYQSGLCVEEGKKRRYEPSQEEEEAYLHAKRMVNKLKIELI